MAILSLLSVFCISPVSATEEVYSGECGEDLTWLYNPEFKRLEISGTGDMWNYRNEGPWIHLKPIIESVLLRYGVTSVGDNAFAGLINLEGFDALWNGSDYSLERIGEFAFYGCYGMSGVINLPEGMKSIGFSAFYMCNNINGIVIPSTVTEIGENAFGLCDNLEYINVLPENPNFDSDGNGVLYSFDGTKLIKVPPAMRTTSAYISGYTIPNTVTEIGNEAFLGCNNLTRITIPNSVTKIGTNAFMNCIWLSNVSIPSGVTVINDGLFSGCRMLSNITINNSITSIGDHAYGGTAITTIEIPNSVTEIGISVFSGCKNLTSVTFPENLTTISEGMFSNCTGLLSFEIPTSITSIGMKAFESCGKLSEIIIPNTVTTIGDQAFRSCNNLTQIDIPDSVTTIGGQAFASCESLTGVTIPAGVATLGDYPFDACINLTSIDVDDNNANYCDIDGVLFDKEQTILISYPAGIQGAYIVPNGTESIGAFAFSSCRNLTAIEIPDSVTSIGTRAFGLCSGLTSIDIPAGVTAISDILFLGCTSLVEIVIPDGVESIGNSVFTMCNRLQNIIIPSSVQSIGDSVFASCNALDNVYYKGSAREWKALTEGIDVAIPAEVDMICGFSSTDEFAISWDTNTAIIYAPEAGTKTIIMASYINDEMVNLKHVDINLSQGYNETEFVYNPEGTSKLMLWNDFITGVPVCKSAVH
jgi:hypothetical protein